MNKMKLRIAAVAAVLLAVNICWSKEEPGEIIKLIVDLSDGSHIIGTPSISSLSIQTAYAKMEIPLGQIQNIKMAEDHETAMLELANGDRLKGAVILDKLDLQTLVGKVSLSLAYVRSISVSRMTSGPLSLVLKESLVFHYSFDKDEGKKVADMAGDNDGVVEGARWIPGGKVGGAMEFTRKSDLVDSIKPAGIEGAMKRTLAAWIRCNVLPAHHIAVPVGFGEANSHANPIPSRNLFSLCITDYPDAKIFCFGLWGVSGGDLWSNVPVTTGRWQHVVATFDGETVKLYVDGKLAGSKQTILNTCSSRVSFNKIWGDYPDRGPFQGTIDEVMIFNRALSGSEVNKLYDSQK